MKPTNSNEVKNKNLLSSNDKKAWKTPFIEIVKYNQTALMNMGKVNDGMPNKSS